MNKLVSLLAIFILLLGITSCNDDNNNGEPIDPITDVEVTPFYGSVILSWSLPKDELYYYTLITYVDAEGNTVRRKSSRYNVNESNEINEIIGGFTDENSYDFTLTNYSYDGVASEPVTISAAPLSRESANEYVVTTVEATPANQGAEVSWENGTGVECYVVVSFTTSTGTTKEYRFNASSSGKGIVVSFVEATQLTVIVENAKGVKSEERTLEVTPLLGEISKEGMSIRSVSSDWGGLVGSYLIDNDIYTFWHTQLSGYPHNIVIDLGGEYNLNKIELVRRQDDDGNGQWAPNKVQFLYSMDGENFTDIGEFDFDVNQIFGHEYSFAPVYARYIKLVGISGGQPWMHMAEIYFYYTNN